MNKIVKKANKMNEFNGDIPDVEIGNIVELGEIWDGEGESPLNYTYSCSYKLTDVDYIDYAFEVVELNKDDEFKTKVKITDISLI